MMTSAVSVASAQKSNKKEIDKFLIKVDGLGCPFCAYGLEKKFKEFKGIKKVKINMETGIFTFQYPSEKMLSVEKASEQVDAAGYTPIYVKVTRADGTKERFSLDDEKPVVDINEKTVVNMSVEVNGSCGMCKSRIERAAAFVAGVTKADWNKDEHILNVSFDASKTSLNDIEEAVAKAGYDTENVKAAEEDYAKLPGCCQYDRD